MFESIRKMKEKNLIFVQEEYGIRHWVGKIPKEKSLNDIIEWYKNLNSVIGMFFNPKNEFPVLLTEIEDIADDNAKLALWASKDNKTYTLDRENVIAFFHLHEDSDSYMKVVGGEYHYHKGYDVNHEIHDNDDDDDDELEPISLEELKNLKETHPYAYEVLSKSYKEKEDE